MSARPFAAALIAATALASLACGRADPPASRAEPRQIAFSPALALHDRPGTLLARPDLASEDRAGRIVITDLSDRDVKSYDSQGTSAGVIGRAGHGPGEFESLMMAQSYRDSVVAYDLANGRLTTFGPGGRPARSVPLPRSARFLPFSARVVDDSLLLLIGAIPGMQQHPLLKLIRFDGSTRSSFLALGSYLGTDPQVAMAVGVVADGADGRIFASLAGGDSVWAFDYDGRRLGAFSADPVQPLATVRSLIAANRGRLRRATGGYVVDGKRRVIGLVALDSGTVALQVSPYDGHTGVDPLDGGTLVVSALSGDGAYLLARSEITGALLGRDRHDRLLILRYATPEANSYLLLRGSLAPHGRPP